MNTKKNVIVILLLVCVVLTSCTGETEVSPIKGIKSVKCEIYNFEVIGNDTIVSPSFNSRTELFFDEQGIKNKMIFTMKNLNVNNQTNIDFDRGDTTVYLSKSIEDGMTIIKSPYGDVEKWLIEGCFIIRPNPFNLNQPHSIEKYDEKGCLIKSGLFLANKVLYTERVFTHFDKSGFPIKGIIRRANFKPETLNEEVLSLNFEKYDPYSESFQLLKLDYMSY